MRNFFMSVVVLPIVIVLIVVLAVNFLMGTLYWQEVSDTRYRLMSIYAISEQYPENVRIAAAESLSDGFLSNGEYDEVNELITDIEENNNRIEKAAIIREFKKTS